MDLVRNLESVAVWASLTLEAILIARLIQLRLARRYRLFALYLAADALRTMLLMGTTGLNWRGTEYLQLWLITVPLVWMTLTLATFELCELIHDEFHEEGSRKKLSRIAIALGAGLALAMSAIIAMPLRLNHYPVFQGALLINRAVYFGCAVAVIGQAAFLLLAKRQLPANLRAHRWILTAFILSLAIKAFLTPAPNRGGTALVNLIQQCVGCLCFIAWLVCIKLAGERRPSVEPISKQELAEIIERYEATFRS